MRLYSFELKGQKTIGIEKDGKVCDVFKIVGDDMLNLIQNFDDLKQKIINANLSYDIDINSIRILPPLHNPQKIICVGQNYLDHCREQNVAPPESPIIFSKYPTALIGAQDEIKWPHETQKMDYEAELAVIISKKGKRINKENASDYIFGFSIMNDVSARDLQYAEKQWVRAKSLDTFAPFGPCIVTKDEILNPQNLSIRSWLNDKIMQDSNTNEMIFNIGFLIEFISRNITLTPGDVISTGTPDGVGHFKNPPTYMKPGDKIRIEIEQIGTLDNPIIDSGY